MGIEFKLVEELEEEEFREALFGWLWEENEKKFLNFLLNAVGGFVLLINFLVL